MNELREGSISTEDAERLERLRGRRSPEDGDELFTIVVEDDCSESDEVPAEASQS